MQKEKIERLARLIHDEVQAQMKRYAMAQSREEFINRLTEVLGPALSHYYRRTLAALNGCTDQVEKWQQQEDDFITQFSDRLLDPTKAKNLDRRKAVQKAVAELKHIDAARRRKEMVTFQQTYRLRSIEPLPENADEAFFVKVREIVDSIFPERQ